MMARQARQPRGATDILAVLFDPANVFLFVLGAVLVSMLGGAVYAMLNAAFDPLGVWWSSLFIMVITIIILLVVRVWLKRSLDRQLHAPKFGIVAPERVADPHRALAVIVSQGSLATAAREFAIRHHARDKSLEHVWLIHSDDTRTLAEETAAAMRPHTTAVFRYLTIPDIDSTRASWTIVGQLIDGLPHWNVDSPLTRDDLIVDVTGGTKMMTAGAVLACVDRDVAMQYVRTERNDTGAPIPGTEAAIKVDYEQRSSPLSDDVPASP